MQKTNSLRSQLGKVKGLGAAHHGVSHWWLQRLTAVAIIPLSLWFTCNLFSALLTPGMNGLAVCLASPFAAIGMALLLVAVFAHAKLGLQVIIEDYVHCPFKKYTLLIGSTFVCYGALALGILSVLKLHMLDITL